MFRLSPAAPLRLLVALAIAALTSPAVPTGVLAGQVAVAVAANFTEPARQIGALFEEATGHRAVFSFGSTGVLYAQISQGAPFEVFLAADTARPQRAIDEGVAVPGTSFTYAAGRIVLFSKDESFVRDETTLRDGNFAKIAIANPDTAPYGAAAVQAMQALGVYDTLQTKIVQGNNIAQAYQFVDTSNAEVGFVALSQIAGDDQGSHWIVPDTLHAPIAQGAVLLTNGADSDAARAFLAFLRGPEARAIAEKYGYGPAE